MPGHIHVASQALTTGGHGTRHINATRSDNTPRWPLKSRSLRLIPQTHARSGMRVWCRVLGLFFLSPLRETPRRGVGRFPGWALGVSPHWPGIPEHAGPEDRFTNSTWVRRINLDTALEAKPHERSIGGGTQSITPPSAGWLLLRAGRIHGNIDHRLCTAPHGSVRELSGIDKQHDAGEILLRKSQLLI